MIIYYFPDIERIDEEKINTLVCRMPEQQQRIIGAMKLQRHKAEQAVAYTMLCYALEKAQQKIFSPTLSIEEFEEKNLDIGLGKMELPIFEFGEHGKPSMINHKGIYFNISHCREAVAIGVYCREIGIDVEGRRKFSETLVRRSFNDEEREAILSADIPEKEFARQWTRKEAWFKWTGTGILLEHMQTTAADAIIAGCTITTVEVNPPTSGKEFFLSIAV